MKRFKHFLIPFITFYFLAVNVQKSFAQLQGQPLVDSLIKELPKTKNDTSQIKLLLGISRALIGTDPSASMKYADQAMKSSQQHNWQKGIALSFLYKARDYRSLSDYFSGLENSNKSFQIFNSIIGKEVWEIAIVR